MSPQRRTFWKGTAFGAAAAVFLLWLYPEVLPSTRQVGPASDLPTLARLRQAGVVLVGFANEAPYAYLDPKTGRLTGESPEIARVIFKRLGVGRVEGVLTEFGALIPGLKAGRFDVIAAGMYITPARCKEVAFSNPTYGIGEAMVVAAGNPLGLHSYADVARNDAVTLGVVTGAIQRRYALASAIPQQRLQVFPDAPSAVEAVAAHRVSAYAGTSLTVSDLLSKAQSPDLDRAAPFADPVVDGRPVRGYGAFAFRKQDAALRTAFDHELDAFVGSPEHLRTVAPFGFTRAELPGEATATALCRPSGS